MHSKLIPMDEDQKPTDPVYRESERAHGQASQSVLVSRPSGAHHGAYECYAGSKDYAVATEQPKWLQAMQQAMMAHINEHLGFEYRKQIEVAVRYEPASTTDESR